MLEGYIKFEDKRYNVFGVDTLTSVNLTLSTPLIDQMRFLDPDNTDIAYVEKRIEIKNSSISVESELNRETGKRFIPNREFFEGLGVLIKYIKMNCHSTSSTGLLGFDTGEFETRVEDEYEVAVGDLIAFVTLTYGKITKLVFEGLGYEINLIENGSNSRNGRVYYTTKENVKITYSKDSIKTYLGVVDDKPVELDFELGDVGSDFHKDINSIIQSKPNKNFSWLLDREYFIVTDDTLEDTLEYIKQHDILAVDTETTGLKITFKSRTGEHDQLVGVVISVKEGESFYFPLRHTKIDNLCNGDDWFFMETYMKPLLETKDIVVHNASFDWKVLFIYEIATNIVFDTMVAFALTMTAKHKTKYGLESLAQMIFKRDSLSLDDLTLNGDFNSVEETFADLPEELVRLYACADADNTLALYNYIKNTKMLQEYGAEKVTQFESVFACAIAYSEFHGQFVDISKTDKLVKDIENNIQKYFDLMMQELEKVGYDTANFNPNSNPQKLDIIYNVLKCPEQRNPQGKITADKNARKRLANMLNNNDEPLYPFVVYLDKYNEYETLRKNFTKDLPTLFTSDGYSFSGVDQFKTTGRVSIKKPNYQGYNDAVKRYIEPRQGFYMSDTDYSSIEYRVIAALSGQEWLIEAFKDPYMDYHKLQASNMFQVPYELVSSDLRGSAKAFNFGIPFGMGDAKLGFTLFGELNNANTRKASKYRQMYFKGQEKVQKFFINAQRDAVKNNYSETYFGRRRFYNPEVDSAGSIKRQGGNQPIQGTAADIYKQGVVRLFNRIINEGWLDKVLITGFVHDETVMEVSNEIHPLEWISVLKEELELVIEGFPPIYIGLGFGRSWYEAKATEIPIPLQSELSGRLELYPEWDGDIDKMSEWFPKQISDFEFRVLDEYIQNPENKGEVIKSHMYDYLTGNVNKIQKERINAIFDPNSSSREIVLSYEDLGYFYNQTNSLVKDIRSHKPTLQERLEAYAKKNKLNLDEWTITTEDIKKEVLNYRDLQVSLEFYCKNRGIDYDTVDLKSPNDVEAPLTEDQNITGRGEIDYTNYYEDDADEDKAKEIFIEKIKTYGSHLDIEERTAYFDYNKSVMSVIQKYVNREQKGYRVAFYSVDEDKRYVTQSYIESRALSTAQRELVLTGVAR